MHIYRLNDLTESYFAADAWNGLAGGVPFRSFEWLSNWWRFYEPSLRAAGRHVELLTLCVLDGDKLIGIAPWYVDRSRSAGDIVRFLGSGEVCSDYLTVLSQANREAEVAEAIADWLTTTGDATSRAEDAWDILELANVAADDKTIGLLVEQLRRRGTGVHQSAADNTWRIELPKTMEEYLALLSKSHRKQLRQFQRRVFDTGQAVLRTVVDSDQLDQGLQILTDLHQRRLESLGKPGCFKSVSFTEFHRSVMAAMHRLGHLRLSWLEMQGQPVAAEYQLAGEHTVFAYQGGIDPEALDCEPGRLITLATLEQAINAGYQAFDFCRGDEPYKAHFRSQPRENVTWRVVSNRPVARLRHSLWLASRQARDWAKSNLQLCVGNAD